jgi:hypothetical protein
MFAAIMLRKVTDLAADPTGDDPCLCFCFGVLDLHFGFSFPDEEPAYARRLSVTSSSVDQRNRYSWHK